MAPSAPLPLVTVLTGILLRRFGLDQELRPNRPCPTFAAHEEGDCVGAFGGVVGFQPELHRTFFVRGDFA